MASNSSSSGRGSRSRRFVGSTRCSTGRCVTPFGGANSFATQRPGRTRPPAAGREPTALGLGDRKELTQDELDRLAEAVGDAAMEIADDELLVATAVRGILSEVLEVQAERSSN